MNCVRWRWLAAIVLTVACSSPLHGETKVDWDPEKTWVFAVGLLEWQHSDLWSPFPECQKNRRDEQLVAYFRDSGVPDDQITYLQDAEATKNHIEKKFVELLNETNDGDLLVFYFCGHGCRDQETGQTWFTNYDAGEKDSSAWNVRSIFATIEKHFKGNRALLLADCCHSGALYDEARKRGSSKIAYAVLTSSYSHNLSTGNWTFSDCVLAGLRGEALVDLDGDKVVNLQEVAHYGEIELAFVEGQKSMFHAAPQFPRKAKLAAVEDEVQPRVGERIEVNYEDKWYKAKTIDVDGEQLQVHYVDFDNSWDEWVGPDRIRPYQPAQFAEGDKVQVRWEDTQWYPAFVLKAWYGLHLVRYDGFDSSSDEWVGPGSIRLRTE
jgi:hypothetical protein